MGRYRELRKKLGITQVEFAKALHVNQATISKWEKGKAVPDSPMLPVIADYFHVSIDYLLGLDDNVANPDMAKNVVKVPIYGKIPAGVPMEMIDTSFIEEYEEIDASLLHGGQEYFGLKIKGNSMLPEFKDGDTIILHKQTNCENGQFCAVSINHTECTFKKVVKHDFGITLQPLNPQFEPIFFSNQQIADMPITILGVVKEVRRTY